jgi:PAS domain S-box-containing protein
VRGCDLSLDDLLHDVLGQAAADQPDEVHPLAALVLLRSMWSGVALLTTDGRVVAVNAPALRAGGLTLEDVLGRPVWDTPWWETNRPARLRARSAVRTAATGEPVRYDVALRARGGVPLTVDFSLRPVRGSDGSVVLLVAEARDVEDKVRAERALAQRGAELARLNEELAEVDRQRADLVADVSHELRTPLMLILELSRGLGEAGTAVGDQAQVLLKHVDDLLDAARLQQAERPLQPADIDLAELVRRTARPFEEVLAGRGGRLEVEVPGTRRAHTDPARIEAMLANLLSNALKWAGEPGAVRVALRCTPLVDVLEVADDGPGVPTADRERIFARFRQVDSAATRRRGGTGLGLAIVRDSAQALGGDVEVGDGPLGGALLRVRLPHRAPRGDGELEPGPSGRRARQAAAAARVEHRGALPGAAVPRTARPLVLLAEGHGGLAAQLAGELRPAFDVVLAGDGRDVLAAVAQTAPDAVVVDVDEPGVAPGGIELVRELRRRPAGAHVPVVGVTTRAGTVERERWREAGADEVLVKPFPGPVLVARLGALVERARTGPADAVGAVRAVALLRRAPVPAAVLDVAGRVLEANEALGRLLGRPAPELAGVPLRALLGDGGALAREVLVGDGTGAARLPGGRTVPCAWAAVPRADGMPDVTILQLGTPDG